MARRRWRPLQLRPRSHTQSAGRCESSARKICAWSALAARSQRRLLLDDHLGAHRNPVVEINDVGVYQSEAAGRDRTPDRLRLIGAVDTIDGVPEIKCAGAERIAGATSQPPRDIGLTLDHFLRRRPVRPLLLAGNLQKSLPLKTLAADADPVAQRATAGL